MPPVVTLVVLGLLVLVIVVILVRCIRIVQQSRAYIIERLGAYHATWNVGLHFKIPFIERVAKVVSLKEQVADFQPQPVITKDNVTMQIDTVVYFQITDPMLYTYGIDRPLVAIENLSATTLRNIIGDLELDQCLTSRDVINTKMRSILDEATDPWGIKVNRVELKNILPPKDIQNAMEKIDIRIARTPRGHTACRGRKESRNTHRRGREPERDTPRRSQEAGADTRSRGPRRGHTCRAARHRRLYQAPERSRTERPGHTHPRARGFRRCRRRQGHQDNHTQRNPGSGRFGRGHSRERQRAEGRVQLRSEPI